MFLTILSNITLSDANFYALLGYAVVFFGLILLMIVVILLGKAFIAQAKKETAAPIVTLVERPASVAPGSAGGVKLHNVEPRTAAMLMAIVADKMGKPINELRFISIKEVEQ